MSSSELPPFEHTATFKYTEPPNAQWNYGDGVDTTTAGRAWAEGEKEGWKHIDAATASPMYVPRF
jgi:hypothetical protein